MRCVTVWEHLRTQLRTSGGYFQGVTLTEWILFWRGLVFILPANLLCALGCTGPSVLVNPVLEGIWNLHLLPIRPVRIKKWFTSYSVDTSQDLFPSYLLTLNEAGRSLWSSPLAFTVIRQKARKSAFQGSGAAWETNLVLAWYFLSNFTRRNKG